MSDREELKGPPGYIAYDTLMSEREKHSRKIIGWSLERGPTLQEGPKRDFTFRTYCRESVGAEGHKTFGIILWLISGALDSMMKGLQDLEDEGSTSGTPSSSSTDPILPPRNNLYKGVLELTFVFAGICQVIKDGGSWKNGYPLTSASDVPWGQMDRKELNTTGEPSSVVPVVPREIVSAIKSLRKEIRALAEPSHLRRDPPVSRLSHQLERREEEPTEHGRC